MTRLKAPSNNRMKLTRGEGGSRHGALAYSARAPLRARVVLSAARS
ncbi:MAG: hypothetical protein ACRET7_09995 [Burkholderiales bacterium]